MSDPVLLPEFLLNKIIDHFSSGNKIFFHPDRGHYSQPCWDGAAQSFSQVCKHFRSLIMARRFKTLVVKAKDDWADPEMDLSLDIRESIRSILLLRTFKAKDFAFLHSLPKITSVSNINLTNQHLYLTSPVLPNITALSGPSELLTQPFQVEIGPILRTFPGLQTLSFRPDVDSWDFSTRRSTLMVIPKVTHLRLDMRKMDDTAHETGWEKSVAWLRDWACPDLEELELVYSWHVCRTYASFLSVLTEQLSEVCTLPFKTLHIHITPAYHRTAALSSCGPPDAVLQSVLAELCADHPTLRQLRLSYVNRVDYQGNVEETVALKVDVDVVIEHGVIEALAVQKTRTGDGVEAGEQRVYELDGQLWKGGAPKAESSESDGSESESVDLEPTILDIDD